MKIFCKKNSKLPKPSPEELEAIKQATFSVNLAYETETALAGLIEGFNNLP